ncbi:MAG: GMC oxidoreductase, partial [Pseudomonadota bacterium]
PATSCVDPGLRWHGADNLWVLGGSAYPTGAPANPTLTLSALSLRAASMV